MQARTFAAYGINAACCMAPLSAGPYLDSLHDVQSAHNISILNLRDQIATGLGIAVEKERRTLLLTAAALAGS